MKYNFSQIMPLVKIKKVLLVGENHGVVENTFFIRKLVGETKKMEKIAFVGFEYPVFCYKEFIEAIASGNYEKIVNLPVTKMIIADGRFSQYHFDLMVYLYSSKIPIMFFDSGTGSWDSRDAFMYQNIEKEMKEKLEGKVILIAGNIHTQLNNFIINDRPYKPLGVYFNKKDVFLIKLQYHSGEFFNFERRKFNQTLMPSQRSEVLDQNEVLYHLEKVTATESSYLLS